MVGVELIGIKHVPAIVTRAPATIRVGIGLARIRDQHAVVCPVRDPVAVGVGIERIASPDQHLRSVREIIAVGVPILRVRAVELLVDIVEPVVVVVIAHIARAVEIEVGLIFVRHRRAVVEKVIVSVLVRVVASEGPRARCTRGRIAERPLPRSALLADEIVEKSATWSA